MKKRLKINLGDSMLVLSLLFMQSVEYVECNSQLLLLKSEDRVYDIDFFNVIFYEESGRIEACKYLREAENIQIEEEKLAQNGYYIYVDEKVLQEIVIDKGLGKQSINYVGYLHDFDEMENKVIAKQHELNRKNRSIYVIGFLFSFVLLSLFTFLRLKV